MPTLRGGIRQAFVELAAGGARAVGLLFLIGLFARPSEAKQTVYFAHQDERLLYRHQHHGGAAFVPDHASPEEALPLVVFLHGTNPNGDLHLWLGGGGRDLRPLLERLMTEQAVRPFVLAAPSQTKNALLPRGLWQEFDLSALVDDVVAATTHLVRIDRHQVLLIGHSAAGCNPNGGLASDFWTGGGERPIGLVSIDPCLDRALGEAFARRPASVPLSVWWQSAIWTRSPSEFAAALTRDKPESRVDLLQELSAEGPNPHEAIVPTALERALRVAFPYDQSAEQG